MSQLRCSKLIVQVQKRDLGFWETVTTFKPKYVYQPVKRQYQFLCFRWSRTTKRIVNVKTAYEAARIRAVKKALELWRAPYNTADYGSVCVRERWEDDDRYPYTEVIWKDEKFLDC